MGSSGLFLRVHSNQELLKIQTTAQARTATTHEAAWCVYVTPERPSGIGSRRTLECIPSCHHGAYGTATRGRRSPSQHPLDSTLPPPRLFSSLLLASVALIPPRGSAFFTGGHSRQATRRRQTAAAERGDSSHRQTQLDHEPRFLPFRSNP
jgi:hypothetical protein